MRAETLAEAVQELCVRFDPALMIEATKDQSLFIMTETQQWYFLGICQAKIAIYQYRFRTQRLLR